MLDNPYRAEIVRAATILTTSYVAGTVISDCEKYNQLMIPLVYVKGSLTSYEVKVEFDLLGDGVYHQETFSSISGGTSTESAGEHTFAPAGNLNSVLLIPIKCSKIKISVKGTGTVTSSSLKDDAILAIV